MRRLVSFIQARHSPTLSSARRKRNSKTIEDETVPAQQPHSRLVPDVIDLILDYLQTDKVTLLACSLISRDWYERSRCKLFHRITIRTTRRLTGFLTFVSRSPVRTHVRILRLGNYEQAKNKLRLGPATFEAVLKALPSLQVLGVYYAAWDPTQRSKVALPKDLSYTPRPIDALELVELINVRRRGRAGATPLSIEDICACVQHFTAVGHLLLTHARVRDDEVEGAQGPEPVRTLSDAEAAQMSRGPLARVRIEKMSVLSHRMLPSILQLLPQTGSAGSLRTALVGMSEWEGLVALGQLLGQEVGAGMEDLSIVLACIWRFGGRREALWRALNLEHCPQLRSLGYWVFMFSNQPRANMLYWDVLFDILSEGAEKLKKLERIKLKICLTGSPQALLSQLDGIDWKQLETLACRFPRLQAVEMAVEHRPASVEADNLAWKAVADQLPKLVSKKFLQKTIK